MPALRKRLFEGLAAAVTELREFGRAGGNFEQGAARACNGASQYFNKHPWCSQSDASPILFLPGLVGNLFEDDGVAYRHDLVDLLPMQALAVSGQSAFFGRFSAAGFLVATAPLPMQPPFPPFLAALFLDAPHRVVVVGISRSPLSIHFALQATK